MTVSRYSSADELSAEVMGYWAEVAKEGDRIGPPKKEIARGFEAMEVARKTQLGTLVLGGADLREQFELFCSFGALATKSQVDAKRMREFFLPLTQPSPPSEPRDEKGQRSGDENKENQVQRTPSSSPTKKVKPATGGGVEGRATPPSSPRKATPPTTPTKRTAFSPISPNKRPKAGASESQPVYTQADRQKVREIVPRHLKFGSILNDSNWWIFRNDCFMIGAIQADSVFYLSTRKGRLPKDDLLWDAEHDRPRVLGRELLMLDMAGCQRIKSSSRLGITFAPPVDGANKAITLRQYRDRVAIATLSDIKAIFAKTVSNTCARQLLDTSQRV